MVDFHLPMYLMGKALRGLGTFDFQYLRRISNMMRCLPRRQSISLTTQPFFAQIEPTTLCNLECRHCQRRALEDTKALLSYEKFVYILDSLPGLVLICLQGAGEPTLNKDLFRMASEARKRGIYVFTVTNLNLPEKLIKKLGESDFHGINVSLESVDPEMYAWFRRGGSLALVESNLRFLSELRKKNRRTFSIGIWATLTQKSIESVEEIFQFADRTGAIRIIQFQLLQQKYNYVAVYDDVLKVERIVDWQESVRGVRERMKYCSKRYGIKSTLIAGRCKWPWSGLFVNANGLLAPCCEIKEYHIWGSLESLPLAEAWRSPEWNKVREGLLSGVPHRVCKTCPFAY